MHKVLIFTSYFTPGYLGGGPIQSMANLTKLLSNSYKFFVLTKNYDLGRQKVPYKVNTNRWIKFENSKVKYLTDLQYKILVFFNLLNIRPDIVYFNSFFSMTTQLNLIYVRIYELLGNKVKIIVAPRGEFDPGAMSISKFKKDKFIKFFKIFRYKDIVFQATSSKELDYIKSMFPHNNIILAQNVPSIGSEKVLKNKAIGKSNVIFYSRITPKKNLLFALNVLEKLEIEGSLEFTIVGPAEDKEYFDKCVERIKYMPPNISVQFIGPKSPPEIKTILCNHDFFFFPTLGENYGHVIYESLISGLPVLISTETPWKGEGTANGIFAGELDDIEFFKNTISFLHNLGNEEFISLREKARLSASDSYDSKSILNEYRVLFNN